MSFFIREGQQDKRKRKLKDKKVNGITKSSILKKKKSNIDDVTSESDNESIKEEQYISDISDGETADAKRNRVAKQLLNDIKEKYGYENEDVSEYLKQEILERAGKAFHEVASEYIEPTDADLQCCRWSKLNVVTCLVIHPNNNYFYSGSKDGAIIKWCLNTGKKLQIINGNWKNKNNLGHSDEILAIAMSSDGKFLATSGKDMLIHVWDPLTFDNLGTLKGHKKSVTSLSFRVGSHQLYSASDDKSIKLWSVDEMAYIETLFGHEDGICQIDALSQERVISCGGRDGSVRLWKIIDETHLIYHGHAGCIDCVKFIDDRHFVSAADDNSLALWSIDRKKPITTVSDAHFELTPPSSLTAKMFSTTNENWISAIASLRHTDLIATGSRNGLVKFWEIGVGFKTLTFLFSVKIKGFINALQFTDDGSKLLVGVGREHRMGRWFRPNKEVKNSIFIINLKKKITEANRT